MLQYIYAIGLFFYRITKIKTVADGIMQCCIRIQSASKVGQQYNQIRTAALIEFTLSQLYI